MAFYFKNGRNLPFLIPDIGSFFDQMNSEQSYQKQQKFRLKYSSEKISRLAYQKTVKFRADQKWRKVAQQSIKLDLDESFEMVPSPIRHSRSFEMPPPNPPLTAHLTNNSDVFSFSRLANCEKAELPNTSKANVRNINNS